MFTFTVLQQSIPFFFIKSRFGFVWLFFLYNGFPKDSKDGKNKNMFVIWLKIKTKLNILQQRINREMLFLTSRQVLQWNCEFSLVGHYSRLFAICLNACPLLLSASFNRPWFLD
jgi:hypothetical protein